MLACPSQYIHQCINRELDGFLVDYVGYTWPADSEDLCRFSLPQFRLYNPFGVNQRAVFASKQRELLPSMPMPRMITCGF